MCTYYVPSTVIGLLDTIGSKTGTQVHSLNEAGSFLSDLGFFFRTMGFHLAIRSNTVHVYTAKLSTLLICMLDKYYCICITFRSR